MLEEEQARITERMTLAIITAEAADAAYKIAVRELAADAKR